MDRSNDLSICYNNSCTTLWKKMLEERVVTQQGFFKSSMIRIAEGILLAPYRPPL